MGFDEGEDNRTIYCGNLSEEVSDSMLYELFIQAGPVEGVRRPRDPTSGRPKPFAFIIYKHECSVPYALGIFHQTKLFNRGLNINSRSRLHHIPVLESHMSEYFGARGQDVYNNGPEDRQSHGHGNYRDRGDSRNDRNRSRSDRSRQSRKEKDRDEPSSWAELNALRGKGSAHNGHVRGDLQTPTKQESAHHSMNAAQGMPDFNVLLQMGQQMMMAPNVMGMLAQAGQLAMGLGGGGMNMQPMMSGGPSDRDQGGRTHTQDDRHDRRQHPYSDVRHDHREDHRRHDRGYSSSRSSHDRERRGRSRR